jgi:DNA polymerase-3 subunit gamma/tau
MSYTVIAMRWRPRKFEDVVGQPHIVTTLKNSVKSGRIAHAYLFSGPRGVGKTSISRILAKAVNCVEGVREEPCNVCPTCTAIDSGGFVDVIEIDAASNRGIDEIRELRETVRYLPMEGRYKVYIIDEAHMLTEPAFNALLKTLEEPPGHNIFVLATTESQKIPYTIMSRCQRFDFRRISEAHIVEQLKRICQDEGISYEEKVLNYVVREADGSLRDAESILDQVISYSGMHISEKDVIDVIGVVQREVAYDMVRCIIERDAKGGLELIARTLEQGHDVYQVYRGLVSFLRDLLMIKVWNDKPPFVFMDSEEYERAKGLLKRVEYYEIQNMVHHILQAEDLIRGVFPKISLEILFINLYNLGQLRDVEKMLESRTEQAREPERKTDVHERREPIAEKRHAEYPAAAEKTVQQQEYETHETIEARSPVAEIPVQQEAGDLVSYLRAKSVRLFGFFGSLDMNAEDDTVVVSLDKRSDYLKEQTDIVNEFKNHASDFFGKEMRVRFVAASGERTDTIDDYVKEAERLFKI